MRRGMPPVQRWISSKAPGSKRGTPCQPTFSRRWRMVGAGLVQHHGPRVALRGDALAQLDQIARGDDLACSGLADQADLEQDARRRWPFSSFAASQWKELRSRFCASSTISTARRPSLAKASRKPAGRLRWPQAVRRPRPGCRRLIATARISSASSSCVVSTCPTTRLVGSSSDGSDTHQRRLAGRRSRCRDDGEAGRFRRGRVAVALRTGPGCRNRSSGRG